MTTVLQVTRAIGDKATEPGRIDRRDGAEVASTLFQPINQIADQMAQPVEGTAEETVTTLIRFDTAYRATA